MPPFYVVNGMRMHLKLAGPPSKWPKPCMAFVERNGIRCHCHGISTLLCDWPVGDATCDMPMCAAHGTEHNAKAGDDRHYCPKHMAEHRAANPELFP